MAIVRIEGFDAHRTIVNSGLDVGGGSLQDTGLDWRGGTPVWYRYGAGYLGGQALSLHLSSQPYASGPGSGTTQARIGFWARGSGIPSLFRLCGLGREQDQFQVWFSGDTVQLRDTNNAIIATVSQDFSTDWRHYEFYVNSVNGRMELRIDKALTLAANATPNEMTLSAHLGNRAATSAVGNSYDHFYMTDGPPIGNEEILGVQVVATTDRNGSNDGFRGSVVIGGQRYVTAPRFPVVDSTASYANGWNWGNVTNLLFNEDPSTGSAWTVAGFTGIEQWGLCYEQRGTPGPTRVMSLHLAYLENNDGRPVVRRRFADGMTSFSGPWQKSHQEMTYAAILRPVPRWNEPAKAGSHWVTGNGSGCLMFGPPGDPSAPPSPTEPVLTTIGLTFAEEFRQDYKDWVRVNGTGFSFESYFISGYSVLGEGNRKFQDNYVTVNYENIPTGQAFIQGLWDYSESPDTGRWSNRQSLINKGGDYRHAHGRFKIRGHGKALSIKITNRGDNPFIINGWTALVSSNASV